MKTFGIIRKIAAFLAGGPFLGGLLIFAFCFLLPDAFALAQTMSSPHYSMQEESVNFAGGNSKSASYGLEDTAGEVATGYSGSASQTVHAGYQQTVPPAPVTPPVTPPATPPSSGSSSGGTLPLPNPSNFTASPLSNGIVLSWTNPTDFRFIQVRVVRSSTFFPSNASDGEVIYEGPEQSYFDATAIPGVTYYYAIFAEGMNGMVSSGALAFARMPLTGEIAAATSSNPFVNVPQAANIDPMIASLSLLDFQFIQGGKLLTVGAGGAISIDGRENLTIRLRYDRVPQILKTIALGLSDPTDHSRAFIFLLRPNADKSYYEATMGPLGKSGSYPLSISILDYQNQGLKQLAGSLNAYTAAAVNAVPYGSAVWDYLWILAIILLAIIIAIIIWRRRRNRKGGKGGCVHDAGETAAFSSPAELASRDRGGSVASAGAEFAPSPLAISARSNSPRPFESSVSPASKEIIPPPPAFTTIPIVPSEPRSQSIPIVVSLFIFAMVFRLFAPIALAAFNPEINYQGKLMDLSGNTVSDGSYNVEFKLYTAPTGGTAVWTEDDLVSASQGAALKSGLFSVMLGSTTPFTGVDFNQTLYLGVDIGGTTNTPTPTWDGEMSPRKILGAVPAAFEATNAVNAVTAQNAHNSQALNGLNSSQFLRSDAQNATSSLGTFINVLQSGAGKIAEFFGAASQSVLSILSNGNVGVGTTTPFTKFAVQGDSFIAGSETASNFIATSSTASQFPYASTTAITIGSLDGVLFGTNGAVSAMATSSLGLASFSTTSAAYWQTQNNFFSTTSSAYWLTQNTSNAYSTTSSNYWLTQNTGNAFSTTSASYFLTQNAGNAFSTTSNNYWLTQNTGNAFSTTSADYYANGSSTIPKTYSNNTFTGDQTFNGTNIFGGAATFNVSPILGSLTGASIRCLQVNPDGSIGANAGACGTGSGSGLFSWSTTTSQVAGESVNYSNNTTDIMALGGVSTTTAKYWFDPNAKTSYLSGNVGIGTTSPYAALSVVGSSGVVADHYSATSTTATSTFAAAITVGAGQGTSTFAGGVQANLLNVTSTTASSTFANGVNLTNGCYSVNGTCVQSATTSMTIAQTYGTAQTGNIWLGTTTGATNNGLTTGIYITNTGGSFTFNATTSGILTAAGGGTGISNPTAAGILLGSYAGGGWQQLATSSLGLLSFSTTSAAYWQTQNNFFSTTSSAYWLTQNTGNAFSTTSSAYWLTQNIGNAYSTTSANYWLTQNIGNAFSTTSASYFLTQNTGNAFSSTSANYWIAQYPNGNLFSTTSSNYWLTQNTGNAFSTTSSAYWLTQNTGNAFSTTSSAYWLTQNTGNAYSTTSANYWLTQNTGNAFSTTSSAYWLTLNTGNAFSTTSADYYVNSSTTIPKTYTANAFNSLQQFNANASTTILSVSQNGTATTTILSNATSTFGAGLSASIFNATSATASSTFANGVNLTNGCYSVNGTCIQSATTSMTIAQTYGTAQTGNISLGTTTGATNNGLTTGIYITNTNGSFTFNATTSGILTAAGGGTGISNPTAAGILLGSYAGGGWQQLATSSLGLLSFSTTSAAYWQTQNNFFSTTSSNYWLAQNTGNAYSTTSANYWLAQNTGNAFSTTSSNYWLTLNTGNAFSTTSADYYVNGSSTIPKTYTANVFNALQQFNANASTTILSVSQNGTATTTILSNATSTFGSGLSASIFNATSATASSTFANGVNLTNGCYSVNGVCVQSATTSMTIAQTYGTAQIGNITLGTSTGATNNGLTTGIYITNTGGSFTFNATTSGILTAAGGGTGISSTPNYGQLLLGNASNGYTLSATSSLGLLGSSTISLLTNNYLPKWNSNGTFANSLVYDNGTNVGIGTTSPYAALSVVGSSGIVADHYSATSTTATSTFSAAITVGAGQGTSTFAGGVSANLLNITSTMASSTFANGVNLTSGCYSINGNCIATTTGTSIAQTYGTAQTGNISLGTSTGSTNNGLTTGIYITNTNGSFTFNATTSGILTAAGGGTGISNPTAAGILLGSYAGGGWQQLATSSLGLLSFSTTSAAYWLTLNQGNAFSTTSSAYWLTQQSVGAAYDWKQQANAYGVNSLTPTSTVPLWIQSTATSTFAGGIESWSKIGAPYFIATSSTASTFPYASTTMITATTASTTNLIVSNSAVFQNLAGATTRCLQVNSDGTIAANTAACASAVAAGSWSTTTSSVAGEAINYSSNNISTDIVAIGGNSTTTAKFWFDPNQNMADFKGNLGLGTTTPWTTLSVVGSSDLGNFALAGYFTATSSTATSTFAGGLDVGNGSLKFDVGAGVTSISNLQLGNMSFDTDAGVVSWMDLPVDSTPAAGVAESYSASVGGNALLTVYAQANGGGGIQNGAVGIGTTSPFAVLSVQGNSFIAGNETASSFIATSSVASQFPYASTTMVTATTASTTNLILSGLNGPLQANAGVVSATTSVGVLYGGTGLTSIASSSLLLGNALGGYTAYATSSLGILSATTSMTIAQTYGTAQTGNIWLGTTTGATNNGLTTGIYITNTNGSFAFNATTSGILTAAGGGTGISTAPNYGQLLMGNASNGYTLSATSSLGLLGSSTISLLTNNYLPKWNSNGTFANSLVYDNGTNVGIGSTTPWATLSIGIPNYSATAPMFAISSSTSNGTTTPFIVDNNGNVGIGTSTPYARLSISANANETNPNLFLISSSTSAYATTTLFAILNTGKVGIGTSTPYATLSVNGSSDLGISALAGYFTATSTTATSTFAAAITVGAGQGTSTFAAGLSASIFNATSATASSTFANGVNLTNGCFSIGGTCVQSATTSMTIAQTYGTAQTGNITLGTTTGATNNGLTTGIYITNTGGSFTFNATTSGILTAAGGGTGLSSTPNYGQLLLGNSSNGYSLSATSSLGLLGSSTISSLSNNYLPKWNSNGTFVNSLLYDTGTNVGIGTTSPAWNFEVAGTRPMFDLADFSAGANLKHWLMSSEGGNFYLGTSSDAYATSSLSALTVTSNGLFGIATTSPYAQLSVGNYGVVAAGSYNADNPNATSSFAGNIAVAGTADLTSTIIGPMVFDTDACSTQTCPLSWIDMPLASATGSQSYSAQIAEQNILTVYATSSGNGGIAAYGVGIGTTTPFALLSLQGVSGGVTPLFAVSTTTPGSTNATTTFLIDQNGLLTMNTLGATSTVNGNLWVNGSFRASNSYAGDLIFGNGFSVTEAPIGASSTQGLLVRNQNGQDVLTADEKGNLSVAGDVCSQGMQCFGKSIGNLQNYVSSLASSTSESLFAAQAGAQSAQSSAAASMSNLTASVGNAAQSLADLTVEMSDLSSTTAALDLKANAFSSTTLQLVNNAISELPASTTFMVSFADSFEGSSTLMTSLASSTADALLNGGSATTTAGGSAPSFIQRIASAVMSSIQSVANWAFTNITATLGIFNRVETQTAAVTNGLEMTDSATGQIYCVRITNGNFDKTLGACSGPGSAVSTSTDLTATSATSTQPSVQDPSTKNQTNSNNQNPNSNQQTNSPVIPALRQPADGIQGQTTGSVATSTASTTPTVSGGPTSVAPAPTTPPVDSTPTPTPAPAVEPAPALAPSTDSTAPAPADSSGGPTSVAPEPVPAPAPAPVDGSGAGQ